jgi:hypothetical protein
VKFTSLMIVTLIAGALSSAPAISLAQGVPRNRRPGQSTTRPVKEGPLTAEDVTSLAQRWGIRIEAMRLASDGYMLEFRYRVVDADKAHPLFVRGVKAHLTDEASGMQTTVPNPPTTGALRSTYEPKAGRTYFMFFANPARYIKPGNTVTVAIGEFTVSGVPVTDDSQSPAREQQP